VRIAIDRLNPPDMADGLAVPDGWDD
jgi:hypothetical protein